MMTFSQFMLMVTVFTFMTTAVRLMPSIVSAFKQKYQGRFGTSRRDLDKVFVHMRVPHILMAAVALGAFLGWITDSWVLGGFVMALGIFMPKIVLMIWINMRSAQFEEQLMDGLILINNAMRSGLDIATGFELVSTNMKAPISEEFGQVLNAYRLGGSLETALLDLTKRIRSRPLETAVGAIVIQRETGGNLIKTFEQLIQTIREEAKLQKKIRAISAQGRMQISFLGIFPWVLAAVFFFLSPDTMRAALTDPMGQMTLVGLVIWEAIGLVVTKSIVTVDV